MLGQPYSQSLSTIDGTPPLTFSKATVGTLPPGLTLAASGQVSGTPTGGESYYFDVNVVDSGPNRNCEHRYTHLYARAHGTTFDNSERRCRLGLFGHFSAWRNASVPIQSVACVYLRASARFQYRGFFRQAERVRHLHDQDRCSRHAGEVGSRTYTLTIAGNNTLLLTALMLLGGRSARVTARGFCRSSVRKQSDVAGTLDGF